MNRFIFFVFLCFFYIQAYSQIHELGIWAGGANFIGDVGKTNYIAPNKVSIGLIYKYNKNKRLSYRFSYIHGKIAGDDSESDVPSRLERNYRFKNKVNELNLGFEFNFFDFDLHLLQRQITPYISSGFMSFRYDELYYQNGVQKVDKGSWDFGIPMVVGIKSNMSKQLVLAFEVGARYTFTDNIDGSNPSSEDLQSLSFGNINSNDWYVFTGFIITYTFGKNPCFCPN